MATVESPRKFVRPDGKEKVTGAGRYTADLNLTGQLHAAFRYADHTHARILRIDASKARALPGVLAVLTHEDVPDVLYGGMVQDRRLFAKETVRFEGDIVAGVAALTADLARQAVALIEVEYEALPAGDRLRGRDGRRRAARPPRVGVLRGQTTLSAATATCSATRRSSRETPTLPWPARTSSSRAGSSPTRRKACRSSRARLSPQWQGDRVTVWSSTQVPFAARSGIAHVLQIPESHVRVIVPLLGGGFGAKCDFHFEGHVAALARAAGRPVKLVFSRERGVRRRSDHRREGMVIELETGARRGRDARRTPRPARARRGRLLRRRRLLRADGGHARVRAVRDRERQRRVLPSTTRTTSPRPRSAPRRRRRCAGRSSSTWTSWPRSSASTPSSCAGGR